MEKLPVDSRDFAAMHTGGNECRERRKINVVNAEKWRNYAETPPCFRGKI
jgi:hypothetical protein